jgi:hypothetical protein
MDFNHQVLEIYCVSFSGLEGINHSILNFLWNLYISIAFLPFLLSVHVF